MCALVARGERNPDLLHRKLIGLFYSCELILSGLVQPPGAPRTFAGYQLAKARHHRVASKDS